MVLRRTIDCFTKDIRQIGVEINPAKCQILTNVKEFNYEEEKYSEKITIKVPQLKTEQEIEEERIER